MILCVTLNPCLDKTLTVPPWRPGDSVRGTALREVVGGKGNNVARALRRLGHAARPVTFLGGPTGRHCEELLRSVDGLDPIIAPTAAPTRVILTVRAEGPTPPTAFFDPDPAIASAEAEDLYRRAESALAEGGVRLVTLSGSSPAESTHHLYSDLIALARAHRVPVFLDTYGPALDAIWGFWPDVIQLNRHEAAGLLRKPPRALPEDTEILDLLDDWARHGVRVGLVTDGPEAVLACARGRFFRVLPPEIEAVNPIGSGDSLLAGLADGWLAELGTEALLRRAVACGAANARTWDAGALDPDAVRELEAEVVVEPMDRPAAAPAPSSLFRRTTGRRR